MAIKLKKAVRVQETVYNFKSENPLCRAQKFQGKACGWK